MPGALDHFVSGKYAVHAVTTLFPFDTLLVELYAITLGDGAEIGQEHIEPFGLTEDRSTYAALTSA